MFRNFLCRRLFSSKKSSYDIEKQYSLYKLKRKVQFDKSFKTFNLTPPKEISSKFEQPRILLSDISNIKQYSHTHPQFLLKQLKDDQSKIHQSITSIFNRIFMMKTEEGVQFLLFLDSWGFFKEDEIEMAKRWLLNQTLNFQQIWNLLKSGMRIQGELENIIIRYLEIIQPKQYSYLFKSLNYYRLKNLGSEQFFSIVEKHIIKNVEVMTGSQLAELISHYANNINENMESKLNILDAVSNRMSIILQHLSAIQLISVLFCYLKFDMLDKQIGERIINKVIETLPKWKQDEIRQLMEASTNLNKKQQQAIIKQLIKLFYINKIPIKLLPSLYSLAIQYSVLQKDFVRRIQQKLLQNAHNMSPQNVSKSCWAFAVVPRDQYLKQDQSKSLADKLFFRKVEEIVEGGLRDYTIKDVTRIVWALGSKQFKLDAPFWGNIQSWLQQQLSKKETSLRDVSLVLWAYTNRIPLKYITIQKMKEIIHEKIDQSEGFDLAMISWFFESLKQQNHQILNKVYKKYRQQSESMQFVEILKCLRWFLNQSTCDDQVLTNFVRRVSQQYKQRSYYVLLNCLTILASIKIKDKNLLIDTVLKVDQQIKTLKQIQTTIS